MKSSSKGEVVKTSEEFVEYDWKTNDYSVFRNVPRTSTKGSGIYALYDNYGLYYIGLSTKSIRMRLKQHTRDRHKGKWNKFSWYYVPNIAYVKDLETTLLKIINPHGNRVHGNFKPKKRL